MILLSKRHPARPKVIPQISLLSLPGTFYAPYIPDILPAGVVAQELYEVPGLMKYMSRAAALRAHGFTEEQIQNCMDAVMQIESNDFTHW